MTGTGSSGSSATRNGFRRGPKRHVRLSTRGVLLGLGLVIAALCGTGMASAYWLSAGSGSTTAAVGTLAPPTNVSVPANSVATVPVTWTASEGALTPSGYYVTRTAGRTAFPACGSSATALITASSCTDTSVEDGVQTYTVTAVFRSWTAVSSASNAVVVSTPKSAVFTTEPTDVVAGVSVAPAVKVTLRNSAGGAVTTAGIAVDLAIGTNPAAGTLSGATRAFTDPSGVATFSSLAIDKAAPGYTLAASSPGVPDAASTAFTVSAAAASKLVFTSGPLSGPASATAVLGPFTVQRQDAFGNPVTDGATTVTLASNTSGNSQFAAASGGRAITAATVDAGQSTASLYYGDTKAGSPTLTATATGLTQATQNATIGAAAVSKLAITSAALSGTASAQANLGAFTVQRQDTFGNPVTAGATTVNFTLTQTNIFSAARNGTAIASMVITAGNSSLAAYYGDTKAGTPAITVTAADLAEGIQNATINAAPINKLVFINAPFSGTAGPSATLGPLTVQRQDSFGNPVTSGSITVTLSSTSAQGRFALTSGGTSITSVVIPAASSEVGVYYGDSKSGTPTVTGSGNGLVSATQQVSITR